MEQEILEGLEGLEGLEAAEEMGRRVLLPHVRELTDIFERMEPVADLGRYKSRPVKVWDVEDYLNHRARGGRAELSSFCRVRGRPHSLDVTPTPEIIRLVEQKMMVCDGYVINFGITVRGDGTALVEAHYNQISSSCWFAIVDAAQIPTLPE